MKRYSNEDIKIAENNLYWIITQAENDLGSAVWTMDNPSFLQLVLPRLTEIYRLSADVIALKLGKKYCEKNIELLLATSNGKLRLTPQEGDDVVKEVNTMAYDADINKFVELIRGDFNSGKKGPDLQVYLKEKTVIKVS